LIGKLLIESVSTLPMPAPLGAWVLCQGNLFTGNDLGEWILVGLPDGEVLPCSENIVAGQMINIWNDGGVRKARSASTMLGLLAHGISMISAVEGDDIAVISRRGSIVDVDYLVEGDCYLAASGLISDQIDLDRNQRVGLAIGAALCFDPDEEFTSFLTLSISALDATVGPKISDTATIRISRTGLGLDDLTALLSYSPIIYSPPFPDPVTIADGETFLDIQLSVLEPRAIVIDLIDPETIRISKRGGLADEIFVVLGYPDVQDNGHTIPSGVDSFLDIYTGDLTNWLNPSPELTSVRLYHSDSNDTILDATVYEIENPGGSGYGSCEQEFANFLAGGYAWASQSECELATGQTNNCFMFTWTCSTNGAVSYPYWQLP